MPRTTTHYSSGPSQESLAVRGATLVIDACLGCCVLGVPCLLGGRHPYGQLLLVAATLVAMLAWCVREVISGTPRWQWTHAVWLFCAGGLLGALQLVPLSAGLLESVSPGLNETLPLWTTATNGGFTLGTWSRISFTPAETRSCLVVFVAYALLFWVTLQRIRQLGDVERLLKIIAGSGVAVALFGLVQLFAGNGKFFWFYEHPFSDTFGVVKGPFVNRNHFASYLAMALGPMVWYLMSLLSRRAGTGRGGFGSRSPATGAGDTSIGLAMLGLVVLVFAGLLSLSRGGTVGMLVAATVASVVLYRAGQLSPKLLVGMGGIAVLVTTSLFIFGQERVTGRLEHLFAGDIERVDHGEARRRIWEAVLKGIADFPVLGTGLGSHMEVNPIYLSEIGSAEYTHAESGYLQLWLEAGTIGLLVMLTGICLCVYWCIRVLRRGVDPRLVACMAAVAAGLAANAVHSLADFMWYIPGCMAVVVVLAAMACRVSQLSGNVSGGGYGSAVVRPVVFAAACGTLLIGSWTVPDSLARCEAEAHWTRYLLLAQQKGAEEEETEADPRAMLAEISATLKAHPHAPRARLRLARLLLLQFGRLQRTNENPMTIEQIRDAAQASEFDSVEALQEWLSRAVGPHYKYLEVALKQTHLGLQDCPLQGDGYLFLAKLGFMQGDDASTTEAFLAQAEKLRPMDGRLLFGLGKEAFLRGDVEVALAYWKRSFQAGEQHQERLVAVLGWQLPAQSFIDQFEPGPHGLRLLVEKLRSMNRTEDLAIALEASAAAESEDAARLDGPAAAKAWLRAHQAYDELGQQDAARRAAEQALAAGPHEFSIRYAVGNWAYRQKEYATANEHLTWCLRRRPNHAPLQRIAERARLQAEELARLQQPGMGLR